MAGEMVLLCTTHGKWSDEQAPTSRCSVGQQQKESLHEVSMKYVLVA